MSDEVDVSAGRREITLELRNDAGIQEFHKIGAANPNRPIYVSVGQPGRRSEIWRIWANKPTGGASDVYVSGRSLARYQKWSLHESGDWRFQWLTRDLAARHAVSGSRIVDRWQRGSAYTGNITKGVSIWVPHGELGDFAEDVNTPPGTTWLPEASAGGVVGIHIAFATPDSGLFPVVDACPFDGFWLANGDVVLALASRRQLEPAEMSVVEERKRAIRQSELPPDAVRSETRLGIFGKDADGNRFVYDLRAG